MYNCFGVLTVKKTYNKRLTNKWIGIGIFAVVMFLEAKSSSNLNLNFIPVFEVLETTL